MKTRASLTYYYVHPLRAIELVGAESQSAGPTDQRDFLERARRQGRLETAVTDYVRESEIPKLEDMERASLRRGIAFLAAKSFYAKGLTELRRRIVTEEDTATLRVPIRVQGHDYKLVIRYRPAYFASQTPWSILVGRTSRLLAFARLTAVSGDELQADAIAIADAHPGVWEALTGPRDSSGERHLRAVLFTDLVGHTEMMQRLGDKAGRKVLREHERITRETLKQHGGTEVKTMGDGFMASFGSVTQAVECAISLQRAFADRNGGDVEPFRVRIGVDAGEPIEEDGDLFGTTVISASRIAAEADAGEILIPEPVRHLLAGKTFVLSNRGEFVPKGFDDAVRLYGVRWRDGERDESIRQSGSEAISVRPISGDPTVFLLGEPEMYGHLAIASEKHFLPACHARLISIESVMQGRLLPERLQPRELRWSSRELDATGTHHQFLDIPPDGDDRFMDLAVVDKADLDHFSFVTANDADREKFGPGWYRVTVSVSSRSATPHKSLRSFAVGLAPRSGPIPAPLVIHDWLLRGDEILGASK